MLRIPLAFVLFLCVGAITVIADPVSGNPAGCVGCCGCDRSLAGDRSSGGCSCGDSSGGSSSGGGTVLV